MMDKQTERKLAKLAALEAGGVDNWEWYGEALKDWFAENELEERTANAEFIAAMPQFCADTSKLVEAYKVVREMAGECVKYIDNSTEMVKSGYTKDQYSKIDKFNERMQKTLTQADKILEADEIINQHKTNKGE